jgi:hypothetical protein
MLGGRDMIAAEVEQVIAQGKGRAVVVVSGHDGAAVYRGFAAQIAQLGYDDLGAPPLRNQKFADSPVEGNGFELPVPRAMQARLKAKIAGFACMRSLIIWGCRFRAR